MLFGFYGDEKEVDNWNDVEFEDEYEDESFDDDIWWDELSQMSIAY